MSVIVSARSLSRYVAQVGFSLVAVFCTVPQPIQAQTSSAAITVSPPPASSVPIGPDQSFNPLVPPLDNPGLFLPSIQEPRRIVLRLGQRRVFLYQGEQVVASYPVAVGKAGWETPTGSFKIIQKIENPVWQNPWTGEVRPPGPNSALGLRWIGFWTDGKDVIGFHGTPTIDSIGQAASHGCVRMRNEDVVALFEQVDVGTPVIVEP